MFGITKAIQEFKEQIANEKQLSMQYCDNQIEQVKSELSDKLTNHTHPEQEVDLKPYFDRFKLELEERLMSFHKEITERYFGALENFMRSTKELQLIESLAGQVKEEDLANLRSILMEPVLKPRWEEQRQKQLVKMESTLNSRATAISTRRAQLHEQYLSLNRQKKDTKEIETQIKELDWVMGITDEKN